MGTPAQPVRRRLTLERTYQASVEDLWNLWTTKEGIESWWGPEGFEVRVRNLDLRAGGELAYTMVATASDQIEFLKKAGMPLASEHRLTFTEVLPRRRLAYDLPVDFVPGVNTYPVSTLIEFAERPPGSSMVLTFDAMHDEHWTRMALMGRESELSKLERLLKA